MEREKRFGFTRDGIKLLAIFTMTLNHVGHLVDFGGILSEIMIYIGYFTAVTMVYFLVEGYQYTRSKMHYSIRLCIFACLAQIPFSLAFSGYEAIRFIGLNMLFTLLICFLILVVHEKVQNRAWKVVLYLVLICLSYHCDWPIMAPVGTLLFIWAGKDRKKTVIAYLLFTAFHACYTILCGWIGGYILLSLQMALFGSIAPLMSCLVITFLYNGRRASHGRNFLKWFFYAYYPGHLLILALFRLYVLYMRGII